jgi:hypothetical protein
MELKKRCTCAGVRSDWINRHSFSVNESLPGLLFIPQELLADGFGKGKGKVAGADAVCPSELRSAQEAQTALLLAGAVVPSATLSLLLSMGSKLNLEV